MTRFPEQFAPSWLPRQQRRRINTRLRKLFHSDVCSVCGSSFKHNTRTAGGLDSQGNVVLAGECCIGRVAATFVQGIYSDHQIDFPWPGGEPNVKPADGAGIAEAIGLYQNVLAETDKVVDHIVRRGGDMPITPKLNLRDSPWKDDDRKWFERNPRRAHRARMPFPGEYDAEAAETPPGHVLIVLVRQVEPGIRMRPAFCCNADLLPLPDDEATAHALFEVALGREAMPPDRQALIALIEKYSVCTEVES